MLETDYYMNYVGPTLVKVMLDNVDITDKIIPIYGENRNWIGCLWTYKEVFGPDSQGKHFRCDFKADDGKEHWFHGYIHDINQYMNPPLTKSTN